MPASRNPARRSQKKAPYTRRVPKSSTSQTTPFPDAVPSLAMVRRVPTHDQVKVSNESGESERFKPGDSVFVAHQDMDAAAQPPDGHRYWKARIVSIRHLRTKWWLIVRWFYTSTQLKDLGMTGVALEDLGNTELVLSNHQDVIPLESVEARCTINHWDDTDHLGEWRQVNTWYYRLEVVFKAGRKPQLQGINATCVCREMYSPSLDLQRYCSECSEWFHSTCLETFAEEGPNAGFMPVSKQLEKVPEMRGWDGGSGAPWETVGNGRKLSAFHGWLTKGKLPEGWREKLGEEFLDHMTSKKWAIHICPECSAHI